MKVNISIKYEILFMALLMVDTMLKLIGINYFTYLPFGVIFFGVILKKITLEEFLLYALFVPQKYLQLIAVPIYLLLRKQLLLYKIRREIVMFISFLSISGILNFCFYSGTLMQVIFQIGVYYCVLIFATHGCKKFSGNGYYSILDKMFYLQIATGMIQMAYYKHAIDDLKGTFISAHYLGVFLVLYCFLIFRRKLELRKTILNCALSILWLYLCDAKHVWMIFIFSFFVSGCMKMIGIKKNYLLISMLSMMIVMMGVTYIFNGHIPSVWLNNNIIRTYVVNTEYNKKFIFMLNTFKQMISVNGLIGFGVGLFGSQVAITMGKGIIFSWNSSLSTYHYMATPYRNAIEGLMTRGYSTEGIANSSMVLGYPLVSYVALIAELGIIGFLWFVRLLEKYFADCDRTLLIFFFIICFFDTYFEIPSVFVSVMITTEMTRVYGVEKDKDFYDETQWLSC